MADVRRPNLRQYILYLNRQIDKELIEHLDRFMVGKRGNEEMRRLMYAGLHKPEGPERLSERPPARENEELGHEYTSEPQSARNDAPAVVSRLRRTFGGFKD